MSERTSENNYGLPPEWSIYCDDQCRWNAFYHNGDDCYGVAWRRGSLQEVLDEVDKSRKFYEGLTYAIPARFGGL